MDLWSKAIEREHKSRGGPRATRASVIVGLKPPRANRGVWRNYLLLDQRQWRRARRVVLAKPGVTLVADDPDLPSVAVKVATPRGLSALRRSKVVDYVDPLYIKLRHESIGCTGAVLDVTNSIRDYFGAGPVGPNFAWGDVLPWNLLTHRVPEAWFRTRQSAGVDAAAGGGATVGVVDTGIFREQTQLQMPQFAAGDSYGRRATNIGSNGSGGGDTPFSTCDHGNRVAGLIAAPRDGVNTEGIAWRANLVTVNATDSVVVGSGNAFWIARGLRMARNSGARIMAMAFGNHLVTGEMHLIGDTIRAIYYDTTRPDVLFIGAAGTSFCPFGAVAWPSYLPEVVSVAGVARDKHTHISPDSCYGDAVDLAAAVDPGSTIETPGQTPEEFRALGASSGATATIAGIAALVWARYPTWGRDQVRQRLYDAAVPYRPDPDIGYGVPDAYAAVGGFSSLSIRGPAWFEEGQQYTLSADTGLGDGPFAYKWSTGQTTPQIVRTFPNEGESQTTMLTATDLTENKSLTVRKTVRVLAEPKCIRQPCP
jgi:serine protease